MVEDTERIVVGFRQLRCLKEESLPDGFPNEESPSLFLKVAATPGPLPHTHCLKCLPTVLPATFLLFTVSFSSPTMPVRNISNGCSKICSAQERIASWASRRVSGAVVSSPEEWGLEEEAARRWSRV